MPSVNASPAPAAPVRHVTLAEVASRYRVGHVTVLSWARSLPDFPKPIRVGRRHLWRLCDLERYEQRLAEGDGRATA
jgi:hypothetical protein